MPLGSPQKGAKKTLGLRSKPDNMRVRWPAKKYSAVIHKAAKDVLDGAGV